MKEEIELFPFRQVDDKSDLVKQITFWDLHGCPVVIFPDGKGGIFEVMTPAYYLIRKKIRINELKSNYILKNAVQIPERKIYEFFDYNPLICKFLELKYKKKNLANKEILLLDELEKLLITITQKGFIRIELGFRECDYMPLISSFSNSEYMLIYALSNFYHYNDTDTSFFYKGSDITRAEFKDVVAGYNAYKKLKMNERGDLKLNENEIIELQNTVDIYFNRYKEGYYESVMEPIELWRVHLNVAKDRYIDENSKNKKISVIKSYNFNKHVSDDISIEKLNELKKELGNFSFIDKLKYTIRRPHGREQIFSYIK